MFSAKADGSSLTQPTSSTVVSSLLARASSSADGERPSSKLEYAKTPFFIGHTHFCTTTLR